ncbi:sn-glycerol-3-phosphate ABC transporter ATP-binding protein UgpC [Candidatus Puniceispirillum sp.]|jgi:sn-glycerol 3-phosphate transport system ATP-binding protein|uniref:sn-glycerol-3-phosphate ABC transporter ATP-binding protein UgpC n=1 Tax=Candidatus Puniceispirillum sp. TaxID=2026719 RepID=UPI001EB78F57|nr:sn-glycerol-3-phosphate ABC transporter ATP-binding protein UgpC [Candidatus Puniceispirillum sp.]MBT6566505.1 sn-glycerol-3-phosphate ABC transporter ATP-binding protein UgpC [Candidatus Puniceispirillum sp.]
MGNIEFKNLHKSYAKTEVIHGIDGQVKDGEFVVIVGPSGCGKSTLLRMIAGLETVTDGDIIINGNRVNDLEPAARDIAMVFQTYALYPHMSVFENMSYGLKIQKVPRDEIKRRVEAAAAILEITDLLDRQPRHISGGQRQRVAMGRAIVREPAVFLFDEPLSNLDAKLRVQMRLEIKKLQERLGITSVYVTHDQVEAMTLGDRLMVMNAGVVEQFGMPIDLYQTPASVFVAGFIGSPSMNFLSAKLDKVKRVITLANGDKITLSAAVKSDNSQTVTVGIRPEHLTVMTSRSKAAASITITVDMVEQLGADTLVHGILDGSDSTITARLSGVQNFIRDAKVKLGFALENIHLFDATHGKRLD